MTIGYKYSLTLDKTRNINIQIDDVLHDYSWRGDLNIHLCATSQWDDLLIFSLFVGKNFHRIVEEGSNQRKCS